MTGFGRVVGEEIFDPDLLEFDLGACVLALRGRALQPDGEGEHAATEQFGQHIN